VNPPRWAAPYGKALTGRLAAALDGLAAERGARDGLAYLIKVTGADGARLAAAPAWQWREWFYACCAAAGVRLATAPEVVALGCPGSGWHGWHG
jgi:hypothetical protein